MQITLIRECKIHSLRLPEKCIGKYWITDDELPIGESRLIGVEADDEGKFWIVRSDGNIKFYDKNKTLQAKIALSSGELYPVFIGDENAILYCEEFNEGQGVFNKYRINDGAVIEIGRLDNNQIIIRNPYVSSRHAVLSYSSGKWMLHPEQKTNGTYVNSRKANQDTLLKAGDTIFIMGAKIVLGGSFFAINNPGGNVVLNSDQFSTYRKTEYSEVGTSFTEKEAFYYRSPRFRRGIEELKLKINSPTSKEREDGNPLMLTLAPSMAMGVASFSIGIFALVNAANSDRGVVSAIPSMIMAVSMLAGMIVFPFIMRSRDKKAKKEREKERQIKYLKYLETLRKEIKRVETNQEEILRENEPYIVEEFKMEEFWERGLWGRTPGQEDFLIIRIGIGNSPMQAELNFPEDRFAIEDDILRDEVIRFQKEEHLLMDVPFLISLMKNRAIGIVGDHAGTRNLLNNILLQIVLRHSYDEVKVICLYEPGDETELGYMRTALNIWDNSGMHRFLAVKEENVHELDILLGDIISKRYGDKAEIPLPWYVIVSVSKGLSNKCASFNEIIENKGITGFSTICVYKDIKDLPKECCTVIEVNGSQGIMRANHEGCEINRSFRQDSIPLNVAEKVMGKLGEFRLDLQHGRYDLPTMISFLDMFGVGKIEHLNIKQRWVENNPSQSLRTPVGMATTGEIFCLDLHEKIHGPHGLIAGTTGSGKSEFIITFILSLAVNYHPDEVAFVLIDYKGGGLVGAFENSNYRLPHLAGTITNLDGGAIMRSILSIRSELRRRQAAFNHAREVANEGTMDIYKYQKMYRGGTVKEPMPHLFIISDEFAELKSQQPEFMDQLISTARIGRSLGVHLILATQKPSGVVNEQIWANSKFKICLKVQDRADSMDMLKRPEAAALVETGRFYLQVGYNEVFELGQSAWSGAPYYETYELVSQTDESIEIIDELGNVTDKLKERQDIVRKEAGKQIVRIMEYLCKIAEEDCIKERRLWLPELEDVILLGELLEKYGCKNDKKKGLRAVIGELDDPYRQSKRLLEVDIAATGNIRIYGVGGSGKEMMVQTMLYSLLDRYTPEELNAYIIDFGAELFGVFGNAPQVGAVITEKDSELLENFFKMLKSELKERRRLLIEYGGDLNRYNMAAEKKIPYVLVVVNNYSNLVESYERYEDIITELSRDCVKYGIYFLITATSANAMRYRLTQNFVQAYSLKLNDRSDYPTIFGSSVGGIYPSEVKGRGIIREDETYVFQAARLTADEADTPALISRSCARWREAAGDIEARRIPVVPKFVSGEDAFGQYIPGKKLPLGISYDDYKYLAYDIEKKAILKIISAASREAFLYAMGIAEVIVSAENARMIVFNEGSGNECEYGFKYESVKDKVEDRIVELFNLCVSRNNEYKNTGGNPETDMSPILVVVNEYSRIRESLTPDVKDKLMTILNKSEPFWNVFFIIADSNQGSGNYSSEDWFADKCPGGVWVGNGVTDQIRLTIAKRDRSLEREVPVNTGFYIEKGIARRIKLVMPSGMEEEDEE